MIVLACFVLSWTRFGRRTYAIGNNARASFLAGINVTLTTIILYVLSGLFASLAGIMLLGFGCQASLWAWATPISSSRSRPPSSAASTSPAAAAILGAVAGAITLVALVSVLMAMNMPEYGRNITYGVVIIILLLLTAARPTNAELSSRLTPTARSGSPSPRHLRPSREGAMAGTGFPSIALPPRRAIRRCARASRVASQEFSQLVPETWA